MKYGLLEPRPTYADELQLPTIEQGLRRNHTCAWKAMQNTFHANKPVPETPYYHTRLRNWAFDLVDALFPKDMGTPFDGAGRTSGYDKSGHKDARDNANTDGTVCFGMP